MKRVPRNSVTFNAYGRRFDLALTPNERIRRAMHVRQLDHDAARGHVEGVPGSWVRITRSASGWRGMFFDGQELYAIEAAQDIARLDGRAAERHGLRPVVYRLADAVLPLETMTCEIAAGAIRMSHRPPPPRHSRGSSLELHAIGRAARSHEAGAHRRGGGPRVLHPCLAGRLA